jgi:hypothetical protein
VLPIGRLSDRAVDRYAESSARKIGVPALEVRSSPAIRRPRVRKAPYPPPDSGALTAFTIDLIRPAAAAAAAAIAEESRRCLWLIAASWGGGVPDLYSCGLIGSTARWVQGRRACDAS